jgi:hypothetical protein
MTDSLRTHGALTEDSRSHHVGTHDRKGREGKGREKEGKSRSNQSQIVKVVDAHRGRRLGFGSKR